MANTSLEPRASDGSHVGSPAAGELAHTTHHTVASYNPDAPSEEWGWHGSWREFAPKGSRLLLWLGVVLLLLLNFSTHVSHVENYYFTGIAVIMASWLVARDVAARRERKRTAPPVRK